MPIAHPSAAPQPVAPVSKDLSDYVDVLYEEDDFSPVLTPGKPDHQRLWLNMVDHRVPSARGLADRLVAMLRHGDINVIRLTEPVRQALVCDIKDDEEQLDALILAKLVAVHVRHFLASEVLLVLSEGPGDTMSV